MMQAETREWNIRDEIKAKYREESVKSNQVKKDGSRGNEIILSWGNSGPRIETEVKSSTPVYALGY